MEIMIMNLALHYRWLTNTNQIVCEEKERICFARLQAQRLLPEGKSGVIKLITCQSKHQNQTDQDGHEIILQRAS